MHCVHACMHLRCQMTWVSTHNQSRCIKSFSFSFFQPKSVKGSFPKTLLVSDKSACVATGFYCSFLPPPSVVCYFVFQAYQLQLGKWAACVGVEHAVHCKHFCGRAKTKSTVEQSLQPARLANVPALCCHRGRERKKNATANLSHTDTSPRKNRYPRQDQLPTYNQSIKATSWHLKTNQPIKYWNLADRLPQAKIIGTDEESELWRRCNMLTHSNMNTESCQECKRNKK